MRASSTNNQNSTRNTDFVNSLLHTEGGYLVGIRVFGPTLLLLSNPYRGYGNKGLPCRLALSFNGLGSFLGSLLLWYCINETTGKKADIVQQWRRKYTDGEIDNICLYLLRCACITAFSITTDLPSSWTIRLTLFLSLALLLLPAYDQKYFVSEKPKSKSNRERGRRTAETIIHCDDYGGVAKPAKSKEQNQ